MNGLSRILIAVACAHCFMFSASATRLALTHIGEGSVSPNGVGVHDFGWGSKVTVTATPAAGWSFHHWEGEITGTSSSKTFRLWSDKRATAVFVPNTAAPENALARYVGKQDGAFSWTLLDEDIHFGWTGYTIALTSQMWRDNTEVDRPLWEHELTIIVPWFSDDDCVLLVNGGSNPITYDGPDSDFALPAFIIGMKYAQLDQVPNQPLYFADEVNVERTEDEILAYSLDKYLDTGDDEWPVHEAMVKSVVRAMDVVQLQVRDVEDFLVAGASKRGWTTWLTTAIDPRIEASASLVIDILNMDQQVTHHWEAYGFYTGAVQDYVDFDIFCRINTPAGADALKIVDPYEYRAKYTKPKYMLNASGDQFFLPDASQFYFADLPGPKLLRYMPNIDHYFDDSAIQEDALLDIITWADATMDNEPMPQFTWSFEADGSIRVHATTAPDSVQLWQAANPNARDFRLEEIGPVWTNSPLSDQGGGIYVGAIAPPAQGWAAFFVELTYGGVQYTTEVRVTPDTLPFLGTHCL